MFQVILAASVYIHGFLRAWMPSNIVLDLIRTRRGLKWGVLGMLLAVPYLAIAYWCTTAVATGAPGWLNLVVLVCAWSALKFLIMGPVSLILLAKARLHERGQQRRTGRVVRQAGAETT